MVDYLDDITYVPARDGREHRFEFRTKLPQGQWIGPREHQVKLEDHQDERPAAVVDFAPRTMPTSAEELAATYKAATVRILGELMELMRQAERADFRIDFTINRDPMGIPFFTGPTIVKRF